MERGILKISPRESVTQKIRGKPVFILHFVLWVALSVQILLFLVPLVDSPSFGISLSRTKRGSVLEIVDFPFNFKLCKGHGDARQLSAPVHRFIR
jgi:hypothetical protein